MAREVILFTSVSADAALHTALIEQCGYVPVPCHRIDQLRYLVDQIKPELVVIHQSENQSVPLADLIRQVSPVRVIVLSEQQSVSQRLAALQHGASAYHIAPYSALRVVHDMGKFAVPYAVVTPQFQDFHISVQNNQIWFKDIPLSLSRNQYRALQVLIEARGAVVSRLTLAEVVWGVQSIPSDGAIEALMHRVRDRLSHAVSGYTVQSRYGLGYYLQHT
jgi:DNA-binding response OmpR family regulator